MVHQQMLDQVTKQKECWVQQYGVAVLVLLLVAAVFVVVAELPLVILLELVGVVAIGVGKCPVVVAQHPHIKQALHELPVIIDMTGSHVLG